MPKVDTEPYVPSAEEVARHEKALATFRKSGIVDVVRTVAATIPGTEVVVGDRYTIGQGYYIPPYVALHGLVEDAMLDDFLTPTSGRVRHDIVIEPSYGPEEGLVMHRPESRWRNDGGSFGGSRGPSIPLPHDSRTFPGLIIEGLNSDQIFKAHEQEQYLARAWRNEPKARGPRR